MIGGDRRMQDGKLGADVAIGGYIHAQVSVGMLEVASLDRCLGQIRSALCVGLKDGGRGFDGGWSRLIVDTAPVYGVARAFLKIF